MKKILIGSLAALAVAALMIAGIAWLGPEGALAEDSDGTDILTDHRFSPLDEVLDELVDEDVIGRDQAEAIRERMSERMPAFGDGFHFRMERFADGLTPPPGPPGTDEFDTWLEEMQESLGDDFFGGHMFQFDGRLPGDGFHFRMDGFELPEGLTPPPGPPGTDEFDTWLEEMQELLGDDFFGGHMFHFDGQLPEDGSFPFGGHMFQFDGDLPADGFFPFGGRGHRGPGMMGDGFHGFGGFGDIDDLDGFIDDMTERFGGELPEHLQDMIDHLTDELSEVDGASTSLDA